MSRKAGRSDTRYRKGGFEEGIETTLLMEVDEIVQQEVDEEEEEDAQIPLRGGEATVRFDLLNWEASFSSSPAPPSPSTSPSEDPSLADLLLIDDQGIPYMLTPDGQKVLQVELPKPRKAFADRPRPKSKQTNLESSFPINPSVPALNPESCTLFASISGNDNHSAPISPSVSASSEKPNLDLSAKEIVPKLSPNRLLKSDPASDTKSSSSTETQIECAQSPIPASLSPVEILPHQLRHSLKASPSSASEPAPTSHISENQFFTDDPPYPTSGTPPPVTIFPTNHPKNLNLSPNCPRRILYCQFCPRAFYYLSDLERHSITHSQSKPHVCPLCSKAFKRSSHLERHKHIHTGQRNFICPICAKRFREAGELLRHQRVHTGEKPFQCPQCHMRFAERNTLRRHAKRKHQDQQEVDGQEDSVQADQEDSAE
ncbi:hypothetical protein SKAU_G00224790 [Synaphobranchus kaupii]|uniref:C2H2-type domain-containing protein n=1 Tax=Synaphobranchus kaupii TaxID=118154 RepID=A0A9Q1FBP7_SYNKA|nr:hypothetical protein SKAU_G00224790 [Synaphobranchus kaupii]